MLPRHGFVEAYHTAFAMAFIRRKQRQRKSRRDGSFITMNAAYDIYRALRYYRHIWRMKSRRRSWLDNSS